MIAKRVDPLSSPDRVLWPGEANPIHFSARSDDGSLVSPDRAIVPICRQDAAGTWLLIGTGFFITANGLIATAKHVVTDVIDLQRLAQTAPIAALQFLDGNLYIIRAIGQTTWHNTADVAILQAREMRHKRTGEILTNSRVRLNLCNPNIGSTVFTYAYPKSKFKGNVLNFRPAYFQGAVEEYLPVGRDRVFLPGPCYRTSIHMYGGASGGPAFSEDGRVFGINSTGWEGTDLSYLSSVRDVMPLEIDGVILPGEAARRVSVHELAERGYISAH